ncbi:MAG: M67 family metallopeptidase [Pseudanabaena sp.]
MEPSSPNPFSRRRRGAKPILFSCPLSYGRGARGEGFTDFHVTPVSKIDRYSIDPQEMLGVQQKALECSLEIIGIYHSHPDARAVPSAFDEAIAWPLYSYAIVSVFQGQTDDLQSWMLDDKGSFQSEPIHLLETKQVL